MHLLTDPSFWLLVGLYWIFNAAVGALEAPTTASTARYRYIYRLLHTLAGDLTSAFGNKIPGNVDLTTKQQ